MVSVFLFSRTVMRSPCSCGATAFTFPTSTLIPSRDSQKSIASSSGSNFLNPSLSITSDGKLLLSITTGAGSVTLLFTTATLPPWSLRALISVTDKSVSFFVSVYPSIWYSSTFPSTLTRSPILTFAAMFPV